MYENLRHCLKDIQNALKECENMKILCFFDSLTFNSTSERRLKSSLETKRKQKFSRIYKMRQKFKSEKINLILFRLFLSNNETNNFKQQILLIKKAKI